MTKGGRFKKIKRIPELLAESPSEQKKPHDRSQEGESKGQGEIRGKKTSPKISPPIRRSEGVWGEKYKSVLNQKKTEKSVSVVVGLGKGSALSKNKFKGKTKNDYQKGTLDKRSSKED